MYARLRTIVALMRNPRVSTLPKFLVVGAVLYLLMPVDVVPDVLPLIGSLDDIAFLFGAVSLLFDAVPKDGAAAPAESPKGSAKSAIIDVTPEPPTSGSVR